MEESAFVGVALGACARLADGRAVAVIATVICAWARETSVPTRLMAAVARAAIDNATASHPAASAAA
jgi:hypothetical protein